MQAVNSKVRRGNLKLRGDRNRLRRAGYLGLWSVLLAIGTGCAGHSAKTLKARDALDHNDPSAARKLLNQELKVKGVDEIPLKEKKATPLLVLDRSVISQSLGEYKASSHDLEYADKKVEMLDMSRTAMADVGKYLFSDDTGPYKAPPYEKVLINTINLQNYLAAHDLNGARVEARRLAIIQEYLAEHKNPANALNAPGSYLAGFVFERSGRPDIALRYYDDAIKHIDFNSLVEPITRLSQIDNYSTPALREYLQRHGAAAGTAALEIAPAASSSPTAATSASPTAAAQAENSGSTTSAAASEQSTDELGEVLILFNYGRIPAKESRRIPIGLALTAASLYMSPASTTTANQLAAQGLVTWINFPDLEKSTRKLLVPEASIDGQAIALEGAGDLDQAARAVNEAEKGKVLASAITRMITRVVAGEAARAATKDSTVGTLLSLATQATLTAVDTPDTRSWSTLPARMAVGRLRLPPGKHTLNLKSQGTTRTETFELAPGGWHAVVLTVLH